MSASETLATVILLPFVFAGAAWLGRKAQRWMWNLHLPYEQRVRELRRQKAA